MCINQCKIACYKPSDLPMGAYFLNYTRDALFKIYRDQNILLLRRSGATSTVYTDSFECIKPLSHRQAGRWLMRYGRE